MPPRDDSHDALEQTDDESALAGLRAATAALESIVADRGLLHALAPHERARLLRAAGDVFNPDVAARRKASKTLRRREKAAQLQRDESVLAATGLRVLRERPLF